MKYNDPTGHFFKELWDDAKEAASDFVETVESTVDTVVNYIDTKVEEACTYINDKVDEGFNYVESKFNISDSTPIYGAIKNDIKQKIGFVEGAYEEAISMVTGIASLLVKNNGVISPVRAYNDINNFASDPQAYMNKEIGKLDKIYDVVSNPGKVYDSVVNSINNYGKELEADPYKRGNLAGHATVFVASFFIGAGEAKTAVTAEKGVNAALKAEKELNALSKVEEGINGLSKAELALSKSGSKADIIQFEKYSASLAADEIINAERTSTALSKGDSSHLAASFLTKEQLAAGKVNGLRGGDGIQRTLLQTKGGLDGKYGVFEYILTKDGKVSHQRFIDGGVFTGTPN